MNDSERISTGHVKILFDLERVDDYPPFEVESVWAVKIVDGMFRIDNIPFYVRGLALGDVVRAKRTGDGALQFDSIAKSSGHSTLRVVFFEADIREGFCKEIEALGCQWEGAYEPSLIAVDVPPSSDLSAVLKVLADGCEKEWFDYEEGVIRH
jgi:hypothetical protein